MNMDENFERIISEIDELTLHRTDNASLFNVLRHICYEFNHTDKPYEGEFSFEVITDFLERAIEDESDPVLKDYLEMCLVYHMEDNLYGRLIDCNKESDVIKRAHKIRQRLFYMLDRLQYPINAIYDDAKKLITFYMLNIGTDENDLLCVMAHELFHAYHYALNYMLHKTTLRSGFEAKVVKEALASYFEYIFAKNLGFEDYADRLCDSWYRNSIIAYPYAAAKYIRDNDFFNRILELSLSDMHQAYVELLPEDVREEIDRRNKTTIKVVKKINTKHKGGTEMTRQNRAR